MVYEFITYNMYLSCKYVLAGGYTAYILNPPDKIRAYESLSELSSSPVQPKI